MNPWSKAIAVVLADGGWHAIEDLVAVGVPLVPPGVAYRKGEAERARRRRDGVAGPRSRGDRSTSIEVGARHLVRKAIRDSVRSGMVDRDGGRVRLRSSS